MFSFSSYSSSVRNKMQHPTEKDEPARPWCYRSDATVRDATRRMTRATRRTPTTPQEVRAWLRVRHARQMPSFRRCQLILGSQTLGHCWRNNPPPHPPPQKTSLELFHCVQASMGGYTFNASHEMKCLALRDSRHGKIN